MTSTRTKGKSTIVWLLMGLLLLGLGGFGVTSFSGNATSDLGRVGSTPVEADDYLRTLQADMQAFSAQTGQPVTAEMARQIGLTQSVQARLFAAAALEDEARRLGLSVGDEAVAREIREAPSFKGLTGQFDPARYQELLRSEGLTPAEFEHDVRMDQARLILQQAITGGVTAAPAIAEGIAAWILETRDIEWQELTDADLPEPIAPPDEATLKAWHEANGDRFTAPETKQITYAWLTPDMLVDSVELDEQALRALYEEQIATYRQPERRLVERLVYPDEAQAQDAKARLDAGQATFEQLANERGLELADIDLGEVTEQELGAAGAPVFALDQPAVVGPVMTDLGPALFSMNAILEAVDVPFEQAAEELRAEAALDAARRQIDDQLSGFEDLLAGGASLEDMAGETPMQLGEIAWSAEMDETQDSIAAYPAFRERAAALTDKDFPELHQLDDGGVFALRLDGVTPPAVIPFDEVRDAVLADWTAAERIRRLEAVAEERRLVLLAQADATAPSAPDAAPAETSGSPTAPPAATAATAADGTGAAPGARPQLVSATGILRDGVIDAAAPAVVTAAFDMDEPGEAEVVTAGDRVFLVRLAAVHAPDLTGDAAQQTVSAVADRVAASLQGDLFEYHTRAVQAENGVELNAAALAAANASLQ